MEAQDARAQDAALAHVGDVAEIAALHVSAAVRDGTEQHREPDLGVHVDFLAAQQQQMVFPERIAQGTRRPAVDRPGEVDAGDLDAKGR